MNVFQFQGISSATTKKNTTPMKTLTVKATNSKKSTPKTITTKKSTTLSIKNQELQQKILNNVIANNNFGLAIILLENIQYGFTLVCYLINTGILLVPSSRCLIPSNFLISLFNSVCPIGK